MESDFQELREVYPPSLVKLIEMMTKINPKERITLEAARTHISQVRQQISISGSIRLHEDEESSVPKLSYKFTSKDCR